MQMRKTAERQTGRGALRAICICLLLLLLALILLTEARRTADAIGRERADTLTLTRSDTLSGYVFRDEVTVPSSNNGPIEYLVADGGVVQEGTALAKVYTGTQGGSTQRDAAAPLYEEIDRLERALSEDMTAWQLSYADSYGALMSALGTGRPADGVRAAEELADTLEKRSVLKGDGEAVRVRLATLRAQAEELVRYEDAPYVPVASETGYFCRTTDGREALFGTAAVAELTPEGLAQLLAFEPVAGDAVQNVGKLVSIGDCYLVIPVTPEKAAEYTADADYRVQTQSGTLEMRLSRVVTSPGGEALLIFYTTRCPADLADARYQTVTVEREYVKGLSVPFGAVLSEGDENFVYVLHGGVAEKRRVRVLCEEHGSCIVAADGGEGYLAAGESVLVTWRSVYEGKELKR
jgi:hypothetical protein